jgi:type II secretory pathway pseudopilin PulG
MVISSETVQNIGIGILAAIWLLVAGFAFSAGVKAAQSSFVVANAEVLAAALKNFYNDQDRYPTTGEFLNKEMFGVYLNQFPPHGFSSQLCSQSYTYEQAGTRGYRFYICLPAASGVFRMGSNDVSP